MKSSTAEILREALRERHSNESFEKSLGRAVRKHQGTFRDYVEVIGHVRERAGKDKSSLPEAAKALTVET